MAFRFNFSLDEGIGITSDAVSIHKRLANEDASLTSANEDIHPEIRESSGFVHRCKRHELPLIQKFPNTTDHAICLKLQEGQNRYGNSTLWYQSGKSIESLLNCNSTSPNNTKLSELMEHSDLKSGVYEGGFKIWECSTDLIDYLASSGDCIKDKDVLELGCGGGLPGIFCLLNGANSVCFQDFNEEVIDYFTMPNLLLNVKDERDIISDTEKVSDWMNCKTTFLSGDWKSVHALLREENKKYDLLLSSETIYNTKNYPVFHDLICCCLKRSGYVLLANKSYYFGVGGSSKEFVEYVEMQGKLQCKTVCQITDGLNRDILLLSFK